MRIYDVLLYDIFIYVILYRGGYINFLCLGAPRCSCAAPAYMLVPY